MGTVLKSEAVDVEAHVNLLRQRIHDSPAQRVPGLAAEHRGGERQVVEGGNTGGRSGQGGFRPAEIAHCDLGDFFTEGTSRRTLNMIEACENSKPS